MLSPPAGHADLATQVIMWPVPGLYPKDMQRISINGISAGSHLDREGDSGGTKVRTGTKARLKVAPIS